MRLCHKSTIPACYSLANVAIAPENSYDWIGYFKMNNHTTFVSCKWALRLQMGSSRTSELMEPSSLLFPPTFLKGTASSREQSLCRVPPTLVHPHMGSKIWGSLLLDIYSLNSSAAFHVGQFLQDSMQMSRMIAYWVIWPKWSQKNPGRLRVNQIHQNGQSRATIARCEWALTTIRLEHPFVTDPSIILFVIQSPFPPLISLANLCHLSQP